MSQAFYEEGRAVSSVMRLSGRWDLRLAVVLAMVWFVSPVWGQATSLDRFERQLEQIRRERRMEVSPEVPLERRAVVDYGAYLSEYFFAVDDVDQSTHLLRQHELTGYGRVNFDGVHSFFLRGRVAYQDFNDGDSFNGEGDQWDGPRLERGVYRFDLRRAMEAYEGRSVDYNVRVEAGRQLVHWNTGLVLSREIDGGQVVLDWRDWRLEGIAGRTVEDQFDIDTSRPDFDDDLQRDFFGGRLSYELTPGHRPYVFGVVQRDQNDDEPRFGRRFEYDSYYVGAGSEGNVTDRVLYGVEFAYEGGEGLSRLVNPDGLYQSREDIEAWAVDVRGDYLFNDPANSRLTAELVVTSGDDDRASHTTNTFGGNQAGTDDNAFNGFGLVNTGLAFGGNASNLIVTRLGASSYPFHGIELFRRLQLGVDLLALHKTDKDAPIDEASSSDRYIGFETDLFANWQITSDVSFSTRYGVFFPGEAIEAENDARHFFFSGLTVGF